MNAKMNTKKLATLSMAVALAMILSFVESQIPPLSAVPGVKLGLSNLVAVTLLYVYSWREAGAVSLIRVLLSALLFGNAVSLIYSASGALLSLITMTFTKKCLPFGKVGVSVIGAVMHNAGQIIAACIVMDNAKIAVYIAPLVVSGTIAGVAVGILSGIIVMRVGKYIK